jgi:hypothetical protein
MFGKKRKGPKPPPRRRMALRRAWRDTWPSWQEGFTAVVMAGSSAAMAAIAVVAGFTQGSWLKTFSAALAAGLGTLVIYLVAFFAYNLAKAPQRLRRDHASEPGAIDFNRPVIAVKIRGGDTMQGEAWILADRIREYLERRERGIAEQPTEMKNIRDQIQRIGWRVQIDPWISHRSRVRSRKLLGKIAGSPDDLLFIRQCCLDFQKPKPAR